MTNEELKKLVSQIKKYNLSKEFKSTKDLEKWLISLTSKQIKNFNSLDVEPSLILFSKRLLIDENLLNCDDYLDRVNAMLKLKNGHGRWDLFDALCSPNFLNSKYYYEDMEMISKADDTLRFALRVIDDDNFIKSKFHTEDLKLIVEAKDTPKEDGFNRNWLVAQALAEVAVDINSINSPFHRQDMQLIARSGSECLHSYMEESLNSLAINEVSLNDKYHLENMEILANNPVYTKYLYLLMTNPKIINNKFYREEIEILANAKNNHAALAIYLHIVNPQETSNNFLNAISLFFGKNYLSDRSQNVNGNLIPNYLENLKLLSKIDERFVILFEFLMSNKNLLNSEYYKHDLNFILSINDLDIFMDLYQIMIDNNSLSSCHHIDDINLVSTSKNNENRTLLVTKATDKNSLNSKNHRYDMQYIASLDYDNTDYEIYKLMHYYLFDSAGINSPFHIERLERLRRGEMVEDYNDEVFAYLSELEANPSVITDKQNKKAKVFSRFRTLFNGKI